MDHTLLSCKVHFAAQSCMQWYFWSYQQFWTTRTFAAYSLSLPNSRSLGWNHIAAQQKYSWICSTIICVQTPSMQYLWLKMKLSVSQLTESSIRVVIKPIIFYNKLWGHGWRLTLVRISQLSTPPNLLLEKEIALLPTQRY